MKGYKKLFFSIITGLAIVGCSKPGSILEGKNFENGDWLLLNVNYSENTFQVIDDENFLDNNKQGIYVKSSGNCQWTTCDGILKLYKNGELVEEQGYLSRKRIHESKNIRNAYKQATDRTVSPIDDNDFALKWDSIKMLKNTYPTKYSSHKGSKQIIWYYQY